MGYQIDPELLSDALHRKVISQADLAKAIGSSRGYITDLVQGRRQPSAAKLQAIADVLDVHPRSLLLRAVSAPQSADSQTEQVPA